MDTCISALKRCMGLIASVFRVHRPAVARLSNRSIFLFLLVIVAAACPSGGAAAASSAAETWVFKGYAIGSDNGTETNGTSMPEVIRLDNGVYRMYYGAWLGTGPSRLSGIKYAESSDGVTWTVMGTVLQGASSTSDPEYDVRGPSILRLNDGRYRMYYQSSPQVELGQQPKLHVRSAISNDGVNFTREGVRINIQSYDSSSTLKLAGHGTYFYASNGVVVGIFSANFVTDGLAQSDLKMATSADGLTFGSYTTLFSPLL